MCFEFLNKSPIVTNNGNKIKIIPMKRPKRNVVHGLCFDDK